MHNHIETIDNAISAVHSRYMSDSCYSTASYVQDLQNLVAVRAFIEDLMQ